MVTRDRTAGSGPQVGVLGLKVIGSSDRIIGHLEGGNSTGMWLLPAVGIAGLPTGHSVRLTRCPG